MMKWCHIRATGKVLWRFQSGTYVLDDHPVQPRKFSDFGEQYLKRRVFSNPPMYPL